MSEGSQSVQYAAAFCVSIALVYPGMVHGWSSPVIPKILSGEAGIQLSKEHCSWLASLAALGAFPGCVAAQYLGDKIGRKKTLLLAAAPGIMGSAIMIYATTPFLMYVGRLTCGIAAAVSIVETSIYMGEIADKRIRGALGSLITGMMNLGNLLMFAIGPFVSYNTINWMCLVVPIIFVLSSLWVPETPYYFLTREDTDNAQKAMMKLKSLKNMESIEDDLREMKTQVQKDNEKKNSILELFKKDYRKGFIAMVGVKMMQQLTGSLAIQAYLETIFRQTSMEMSGATASIIFGVVQLIVGFLAALLVDKMGRKPLLLISALGTGISLTAVGIYFYMQNVIVADHDTMASVSWLPVTGIIGFTVMYSIGIANLPYVMQSELFPTNVKSAASSFFSIFGAGMAFCVAKAFQGMVDKIGIHTVFWMFASVSYIGIVFVYFYVPETKGKSLEEILVKLNRKKGEKPIDSEGTPLQDIKA